MTTDQDLLRDIDEFLARTGMAPTRFGLETLGDGALVKQLREGRSLTLKSAGKVAEYISSYRAEAA